MFALSFIVHFMAELGMTNEIITATFYKRDNNKDEFKYSNMLVVLLALSGMYYIIGSTLEYTRRSWLIIGFLTFAIGSIKLGMAIYFLIANRFSNLNQLEFNDEVTAILVSLRFAIMTVSLVGLAKWFNR
jgi:hypothetical protein